MKFIRALSYQDILLFCVLAAIVAISLPNLTSFPRLFFDEGITIEIARNFQLSEVLDTSHAPGVFTNAPYIANSTGYPVTLPLALFFKLFGFGLAQARTYALIWLILFFVTVYIFIKRFWNSNHAISAVLLLATFAPVYDNGRRVLGEIPGFVFLLAGLYVLLARKNPFLTGVLFGLALVTKPSIYLLIGPALILAAIINPELRKKIIPVLLGMIPPFLLWIWLVLPAPFSIDTWKALLVYYQNPNATSLSGNLIRNLSAFFSQTTLLYFSGLTAFIGFVLFLRRQSIRQDLFLMFLIPYGTFVLLYFLKSPGYFRYLLPLELLILIILPSCIEIVLSKLNRARLYYAVIIMLASLQGLQLVFFSNIIGDNNEAEKIANYISERPGMIGIIKSPQIAALVSPDRRLHYMPYNERYVFGRNPLDLPRQELPPFLIIPSDYKNSDMFSRDQKKNLEYYKLIRSDGWDVFELK